MLVGFDPVGHGEDKPCVRFARIRSQDLLGHYRPLNSSDRETVRCGCAMVSCSKRYSQPDHYCFELVFLSLLKSGM